ncbi:RNA ligase family protein [Emticicia sp. TH156]|uniref:RNA ligase family protein n=1 Tax=Emticicia sp. TH156 TaxID=2067454 RepID=UPI000C771D49|nr:RNA ligase family protein [Emticicia sp. TH156]PLK43522.1 2'-5' RNA ligase [Emticicia sp. TH156]
MEISRKYGRTHHYPFSPGATSDDRINLNYWEDFQSIQHIVHTEKLDGENNCLNRYGVFARSHGAPTTSPWTRQIRQQWELLKNDLGDYEIFGENLYAIHSIEYRKLPTHFFVFGIRQSDYWLSWDETQFIAQLFDLPIVPELGKVNMPVSKSDFEANIMALAAQPSVLDSYDLITQKPCTIEGIVSRNIDEYPVDRFAQNVIKYVRKGHVKTDEHWTRDWKRAALIDEKGGEACGN